eukprot:m.69654 g.69654  ORF g.69654 m.69654 type:complete len:73 (+) comp12071_c0_seq1:237-455(+)
MRMSVLSVLKYVGAVSLVTGLFLILNSSRNNNSDMSTPQNIYGFHAKDIDGNDFSFADTKGRVVLVANVASE